MSYLDQPRLHFAGRFFANPGTRNNKLANYMPDVRFLPLSMSSTSVLEEYAGFQYINPYGLGHFLISDCVVTSLVGADWTIRGPALGELQSALAPARIVDLDPDQQSLSQIFGLQVELRLHDGSGLRGAVDTAHLFDLWYGRVPSGTGDQKASGCFQSLLPIDTIEWFGDAEGSLIASLRARCETGVCFKFVLDAYQGDPAKPNFNYGRIAGTLGPGLANEAKGFPSARRLGTCGSVLGPGFWKLDVANNRATIDIGNSMPLASVGGESLDLGALRAVALDGSETIPLHPAPLDYSMARLRDCSGVLDIPLDPELTAKLEEIPLAIQGVLPCGTVTTYLKEDASLVWVNLDPPVLRVSPEEEAETTLFARRAGHLLCHESFELGLTDHHINNRPRSGIEFPAQVTTDECGQATVSVRGRSPQPLPPRRSVADSQVYYVGGPWQRAGDLKRQSGGGALSVLVFNEFPEVDSPTWVDHVEPILAFYAHLYPGTIAALGLTDYESVKARGELLLEALQLPITAPGHFPVSRDLAPKKARLICRWIELGCPRA